MDVLVVDLLSPAFERVSIDCKDRGLALALALYDSYGSDSIIITSSSAEIYNQTGAPTFVILYCSPITGKLELTYSSQSFGLSLAKLGLDALVITAKARRLSYISLYSDGVEVIASENMKYESGELFSSAIKKNPYDSTIVSSRSADVGVSFSSVLIGERTQPFAAGLGYIFFLKNLKGIVVEGVNISEQSDTETFVVHKERHRRDSHFMRELKRMGDGYFIDRAYALAWLAQDSFLYPSDPRSFALDGNAVLEEYGLYSESCLNCERACLRRTSSGSIVPAWYEMMMLGSNLGFYTLDTVRAIADAARLEGLDPIVLGSLLSYLAGINSDTQSVMGLRSHDSESYIHLIHAIGEGKGAGGVLRDGLASFSDAIKNSDGSAVLYDLRGNYPQAILADLSLNLFLPAASLLPKRQLSLESSAIMALYETLYILALLSLGYDTYAFADELDSWVNAILFESPALLRARVRRVKIYGRGSYELLALGLDIFDRLKLYWHGINEFFEHVVSEGKNRRVVPTKRLEALFDRELIRLRLYLKRLDRLKRAQERPRSANQEDLSRKADSALQE